VDLPDGWSVGIQYLRVKPTGEGGFLLHLLPQATREVRK
jgi:hypothetical protein